MHPMFKPMRGFTLIELMMVVAILGIIAAIAIPSYNSQVRKSKLAEARESLIAISLAQERLRASCPFYAQNLGASNTCGASAAATTVNAPTTSASGYYTFSIVANSASSTAFIAQAAVVNSSDQYKSCTGTNVRINQDGPIKSDATMRECWGG